MADEKPAEIWVVHVQDRDSDRTLEVKVSATNVEAACTKARNIALQEFGNYGGVTTARLHKPNNPKSTPKESKTASTQLPRSVLAKAVAAVLGKEKKSEEKEVTPPPKIEENLVSVGPSVKVGVRTSAL